MNNNRRIVNHFTYSTSDASTVGHVHTKQTMNVLSLSCQQEDDDEAFRIPLNTTENTKDKRRQHTISVTAKDGNIIDALLSVSVQMWRKKGNLC